MSTKTRLIVILFLVTWTTIIVLSFVIYAQFWSPNKTFSWYGWVELGSGVGAKAYTLAEVTVATNNFNKEIGRGGFGPVFYGTLSDGQEVAVKVSDAASRYGGQGEKEFFNEVCNLRKNRF
jgi:hypothetical protein